MSREEDRKIAEWLGWVNRNQHGNPCWYRGNEFLCYYLPNWIGDDAKAVALLPVLVEKGFWVELKHYKSHAWRLDCGIYGEHTSFGPCASTISAAITTAILALIDAEKGARK